MQQKLHPRSLIALNAQKLRPIALKSNTYSSLWKNESIQIRNVIRITCSHISRIDIDKSILPRFFLLFLFIFISSLSFNAIRSCHRSSHVKDKPRYFWRANFLSLPSCIAIQSLSFAIFVFLAQNHRRMVFSRMRFRMQIHLRVKIFRESISRIILMETRWERKLLLLVSICGKYFRDCREFFSQI